MNFANLLKETDAIPQTGNAIQAKTGLERWHEHFSSFDSPEIKEFALALLEDKTGKILLSCLFGNSPYLSKALIKEIVFFKNLMEKGYDQAFSEIADFLKDSAGKFESEEEIISSLRKLKLRASLLIALADITGNWELEKVTAALSEFADLCVKNVLCHLLAKAAKRGDISESALENSGIVVIAMGKMGAGELNYSSDIDIIVFYDELRAKYKGRHSANHFFVSITQELAKILSERTKDGYVFRTDLRLRPDPGSTPAAVSIKAAEIYYETLGQNWERAAMIKSRFVAGDLEVWKKFQSFITPYVWRKSLDFASIQDIHSIKRQIDSKHGDLPENLYGYNIKLGRGGIREIEFFIQTQQLIWGGRKPLLRISPTCDAMKAFVAAGELKKEVCDEMISAYRFYRKVEHRLQMIDDHQTHSLPDNAEKMQELAVFLGYKKSDDFINELKNHLEIVQGHYSRLFDNSPSLAIDSPKVAGSLVFTGADNDPETLKTLEGMGFKDTVKVSESVRGWHHGRYDVMKNKSARESLTELMPILLTAFSETANPDEAFTNFDDFLGKLPAHVQIFPLFYSNPKILNLMAEIMGDYTHIANNLSRSPALLDYVLASEFYDSLPSKEKLQENLTSTLEQQAKTFQDIMDITRSWTHDLQFRIGVQLIKHKTTPEMAASQLSDLADVVINTIMHHTKKDFAKEHGEIKGGNFAVVAFGKLGSQELTFGSDLDLVFIYDTPEDAESSDGGTKLSPSQYYMRLGRNFVNAVSSLTKEGVLYEIDLRLRPSGNDGPLATSLKAFDAYYGTSAWAWEYMALTRARVIYAPEIFAKVLEQTIHKKLKTEWDEAKLRQEVMDMHKKVLDQYATTNPFNIKYVAGGILDMEYICQFLQLKHAHKKPGITATNTRIAIEKLYSSGILDKQEYSYLSDGYSIYSALLFTMRLMENENPDEATMTDGMKEALVLNSKARNFDDLKKILVTTEKNVQNLFKKYILGGEI